MHNLDQQVYETIDDLLAPLPTEGCQQRVPNRLRVSPHLTGRLGQRPNSSTLWPTHFLPEWINSPQFAYTPKFAIEPLYALQPYHRQEAD